MSTYQDEAEELKQELKEAIEEYFLEERGSTSGINEHLLENKEMKEQLFENPDIYDAIETYVNALPDRPRTTQSGQNAHMWQELEEVLREMTMEAEGIVA